VPGLGTGAASAGHRVKEEAEGTVEADPLGCQAPEELGPLVRVAVEAVREALAQVSVTENPWVNSRDMSSVCKVSCKKKKHRTRARNNLLKNLKH
jgi:hypothetical protein